MFIPQGPDIPARCLPESSCSEFEEVPEVPLSRGWPNFPNATHPAAVSADVRGRASPNRVILNLNS